MYSVMLATMLAAGAQAPSFGHHATVASYTPYVQVPYVYTYSNGCCGSTYNGCYGGPYWTPNYCSPTAVWGCYGGSSCFGSSPYFEHVISGAAVTSVPSPPAKEPESNMVPRNEAEREAVRKALEDVRKSGTTEPTTPRTSDSPPVPPVKTTPPLTTTPTTPPMQPDTSVPTPPRITIPSPPPIPQTTARITVGVPADARLWVDGTYCPLTSSVRSFNTPQLQPGVDYFYTLRIEVDRNGETVHDSRRIVVSSGNEVSVQFDLPQAVVAQR